MEKIYKVAGLDTTRTHLVSQSSAGENSYGSGSSSDGDSESSDPNSNEDNDDEAESDESRESKGHMETPNIGAKQGKKAY